MTDEIPSVVEEYVAAYNAMDVKAMMNCLADDIHFVNRSQGVVGAETHGKQAFQTLAEQGLAAFSQRDQKIENAIAIEDMVALRIAYRATVAIDLPNGWKKGQQIALSGASFFRLSNGKIADLLDVS